MSPLLALLVALAAPPPAPAPAAPGASPQVVHASALELRSDGSLVALERPTEVLVGDATAGPALIERVDLVWGCRGDRRRAVLLEGDQRIGVSQSDACVVRVDVRPPCPVAADDTGLDDDDARALAAASAEQHRAALAVHHQRMARLGAFSQWGPGLRVVVKGGGPLTLTTSQLALEACDCEGSTARALGDERTTVVLPRLAGPTVLWLPVPRYLGAYHRLGTRAAAGPGALPFIDPFHTDDDGSEEDGGATSAAFSAPAGCDCVACEE